MGITLLALLFLMDFLSGRKFRWSVITEKWPHLLVLFLALWMFGLFEDFARHATGLTAGFVNQGYTGYPSYLADLSPAYIRMLIISVRLVLWAAHMLFPFNLSPLYPQEEILKQLGYGIHLFPVILIALAALIILFHKRLYGLLAGFLFILITLSPALAIADRGLGVFLSDRYTYLPLLGLAVIVLFWKNPAGNIIKTKRIHIKNKIIWIAGAGLLVLFGFTSFQYCRIWKNGETLWSQVIRRFPDEAAGWCGRGQYYNRLGEKDKALADYNQAIACNPEYYWAYPDRARIFFDRGQLDLAMKDYLLLTRADRWYADAFINLGAIYGMKGKYELALPILNRAFQLRPADHNTLLNRALTFMNLNQFDNSIADFNRYLKLKPDNAEVINAIGVCYLRKGDVATAEKYFSKSVEIDPSYETGKKNLESTQSYLKNNSLRGPP
jgi:Tfp pilus assembly protein PilF